MGRRLATLAILLLPFLLRAADETEFAVLKELAWALQSDARYGEAKEVAERALALAEAEYGEESVEAMYATQILAYCYSSQGHYEDAIALSEDMLAWAEGKGETHRIWTIVALTQIAHCHEDAREYAKAEPLIQRALKALEEAGPAKRDERRAYSNWVLPNTDWGTTV